MRVLALTHVFPRAAADPSAPFLLTWAQALQAAQATVQLVAPHDAGLPRAHDVDGVAVRLARYAPDRWELVAYRGEMHQLVRSASGPALVSSLIVALARSVRTELRRRHYDVLHAHWWVPGAIAAKLARPSVPLVVTLHGTDVALLEGRPRLARLARWALGGAGRIETVSSDLAGRLERATGLRADAVNPMPLAPHWFSQREAIPDGPRQGPPRLLGVGRLVPEKGFAELIEAAALLEAPVTVRLVGDGPERDRLAALAAARRVDLEFAGRLAPEALPLAYRDADVVVQPSHREGLGLVAAEAVLCGTPVVAADSGGVRDLLPPGALVPPGQPAALAQRLEAVLADPEGARAGAAALRHRLSGTLSPQAAAQRTLEGYRTVLKH